MLKVLYFSILNSRSLQQPNEATIKHKSEAFEDANLTIHEDHSNNQTAKKSALPIDESSSSSSPTKRSRKKLSANSTVGSVSRSLSYNIGKLIDSSNRMLSEPKKSDVFAAISESVTKKLGILY